MHNKNNLNIFLFDDQNVLTEVKNYWWVMFSTIFKCLALFSKCSFACVFFVVVAVFKVATLFKMASKVTIWNVFAIVADMTRITMTPSCQSYQFIV